MAHNLNAITVDYRRKWKQHLIRRKNNSIYKFYFKADLFYSVIVSPAHTQ
jgi:hypothetical protein